MINNWKISICNMTIIKFFVRFINPIQLYIIIITMISRYYKFQKQNLHKYILTLDHMKWKKSNFINTSFLCVLAYHNMRKHYSFLRNYNMVEIQTKTPSKTIYRLIKLIVLLCLGATLTPNQHLNLLEWGLFKCPYLTPGNYKFGLRHTLI